MLYDRKSLEGLLVRLLNNSESGSPCNSATFAACIMTILQKSSAAEIRLTFNDVYAWMLVLQFSSP